MEMIGKRDATYGDDWKCQASWIRSNLECLSGARIWEFMRVNISYSPQAGTAPSPRWYPCVPYDRESAPEMGISCDASSWISMMLSIIIHYLEKSFRETNRRRYMYVEYKMEATFYSYETFSRINTFGSCVYEILKYYVIFYGTLFWMCFYKIIHITIHW